MDIMAAPFIDRSALCVLTSPLEERRWAINSLGKT